MEKIIGTQDENSYMRRITSTDDGMSKICNDRSTFIGEELGSKRVGNQGHDGSNTHNRHRPTLVYVQDTT